MNRGFANSNLTRTSLGAVLLLSTLSARASVLNWTNTAGGWWSVEANWSPNQVPTTNDIAVITNAGIYTVWLNLSPTLAGLVLGGDSGTQTLSTVEQVLRLNGSGSVGPQGVFRLSNGALSGTNHVSVAGAVVWDGGTIDTNATVTIASSGQMLIGPGANYARILHGAVTNAGTITWQVSGWLFVGGVLHNLAGGLFDAQWSAPIAKYGPHPLIINDGVIRKSVDGGSIDCAVPMVNNAVVDVQTGTWFLADGSILNPGCQFVGAGVTRMDAGSNTINGSLVSSNLMLNGASLAGTGTLIGTLKWSAGTIESGAALRVATNGILDIGGGAEYAKVLRGNLTNAGTITYRPYGPFVIEGVLHNAVGALLDVQSPNRALGKIGNSAWIINDGTVRWAGWLACDVPLINNGVVDTPVGSLALADGSAFNSGCAFTGAGIVHSDGGTNTLNGSLYSENLVLNGATLTGTGTLHGTVKWSAGVIELGSAILVASNALLDISSGAESGKLLRGNLTNAGTIVWTRTGPLVIEGVLHNTTGGLFEIQDPNRSFYRAGSNPIFVNDGTFRKSGGGANALCSVPFINRGVVEVLPGTLEFDGGYANPAGTIRLAGGVFRLPQPLEFPGGLLTGWGTVVADVTNAATIRPARTNGVLTIHGNYSQSLEGRLEFELAGNTPGTNQGRLDIVGAARFRGRIGVLWADGYLPQPGTDFQVLSATSRKGEFCCFDNFLLLGQARRLVPVYSANSLTLATVAAPEPTVVPLRVTVEGGAIVCWPEEFPGYELYWSTNLSQPDWTLLPATANCWLEIPPLAREKFFRLRQP